MKKSLPARSHRMKELRSTRAERLREAHRDLVARNRQVRALRRGAILLLSADLIFFVLLLGLRNQAAFFAP